MKIRQAEKIMNHNWKIINKSSTTTKARQRIKRYERKQPPLIVQGRKILCV